MKKYHNFQFGGNNNTPSETQILPIEVSNFKVFSKYKLATLFMVFALFFYFIDFGRATAADCDGCENGTWVECDESERLTINYAGCNAEVIYEKKVCSSPLKYELRIKEILLSPGCSSPSIENLMIAANKKLLWNARAAFGVSGTTIDVTLYTKSCWYLNTTPTPDKLEPCSNIEDCCVTDYVLATDGEGGGLEITSSSQTNASDSLCVGNVGGACGEYICESQNLPTNVPLWDVDNTICGSECDNPWNADASDFVEITLSGDCKYRAYYAKRICAGETYFTLTQLAFNSNCSTPSNISVILESLKTILFQRFSTYLVLPDTAKVTVPKCWQKINNVYLPCTLDECCIYDFGFTQDLPAKYSNRTGTITTVPALICSLTPCGENICNWFSSNNVNNITFTKQTADVFDVLNYKIDIFPNPVLDEFRLNIQTHYKDKLRVVVLDLLGNELININTQVNIGENELIIDSKKLSKNSFYYLRIFNSSNQEIANGKILK